MVKSFNYNLESIIEDTKINIHNFIYSDELNELLKSFNFELKKTNSLKEDVKQILKFSEVWDYRKNQKQTLDKKTNELARWLIKNENLTDVQKSVVNKVIYNLGLIDVYEPVEKNYDYIFSLGGARNSPLERTKYVADLIKKYNFKPKAVIMLSGMRLISDSEREITDTYAKEAKTEYDLMNESAKIAFNLSDDSEEIVHNDQNPNKCWAIKTFNSNYPFDIISIAGPSSEPDKRRVNSADTYKFFVKKYNIGEKNKILLVTSQIYVPYQMIEAIRTWGIPTNNKIETIGYYFDKKRNSLSKPENYLQEIRATICAIDRFLDSY